MEVRINDVEIVLDKLINVDGGVFGLKKWAGKRAKVVVLKGEEK